MVRASLECAMHSSKLQSCKLLPSYRHNLPIPINLLSLHRRHHFDTRLPLGRSCLLVTCVASRKGIEQVLMSWTMKHQCLIAHFFLHRQQLVSSRSIKSRCASFSTNISTSSTSQMHVESGAERRLAALTPSAQYTPIMCMCMHIKLLR
jgi:hypothetical protein